MKKKPTVYLDATIPSHFYDERISNRIFADTTRKWWIEERNFYHLFVSESTIIEVNEGKYPNKENVLDLLKGIEVLALTDLVENTARTYIREFVMPRKRHGDAYHLASASCYGTDFLLTWNCDHLANANKRAHIHYVNDRLGLHTPEIATPMQLFRERE